MDGTPEKPIYSKVPCKETKGTKMFFIVCDEGWRTSIVCDKMYGWAADWLLEHIQGKPYAMSPEETSGS